MRLVSTLGLACLMLAACAPSSNPPPPTSVSALQPSPVPAASPNSDAVDATVREAAAYAAVAATDVKVVQVESREWPDAALGCPAPGVMYAQVVTPGLLIVVQAGSRVLEYDSDARGR